MMKQQDDPITMTTSIINTTSILDALRRLGGESDGAQLIKEITGAPGGMNDSAMLRAITDTLEDTGEITGYWDGPYPSVRIYKLREKR
jgi:hypothetical protein